jgi:hypothetical protein
LFFFFSFFFLINMTLLDVNVEDLRFFVNDIVKQADEKDANFHDLLKRIVDYLRNIRALPSVSLPAAPCTQQQFNDLLADRQEQIDLKEQAQTAYNTGQLQINDLQNTNRVLTQATAAAQAAEAGRSAALPTVKILKPEPFSGERDKLRPFLAQLRLCCSVHLDGQTRLRLAVSLLRGNALDQVLPYVRDDRIELVNLAALIIILKTTFENSNRVAEAKYKLRTLQQEIKEFSAYFAKFQQYVVEVN